MFWQLAMNFANFGGNNNVFRPKKITQLKIIFREKNLYLANQWHKLTNLADFE